MNIIVKLSFIVEADVDASDELALELDGHLRYKLRTD